jgi:putative MATE family efflux protein
LIDFFQIQESTVAADAKRYLSVVALGMPATFMTAAIAGTFNGAGNSRATFLVNATGLGLNVILDPLFIFVFDMGVVGAATATAIAQNVACVASFLALTRKSDRPFERYPFFERPRQRRVAQILKWSLPIGLENNLFTFFTMIISRFAADFGARTLAVYRVGTQIESLCWLTCVGFASAITAFVGQNYGAGKWERIRRCWRIAVFSTSLWGAAITFILITAGKYLFALFLPESELVEMGAAFLQISAVCQIIACWEASAAGSFRGLGDTLPPSIVTIVSSALRVPLAYVLAHHGLGPEGLWWGITLGASLRGTWLFVWYLKKLRTLP